MGRAGKAGTACDDRRDPQDLRRVARHFQCLVGVSTSTSRKLVNMTAVTRTPATQQVPRRELPARTSLQGWAWSLPTGCQGSGSSRDPELTSGWGGSESRSWRLSRDQSPWGRHPEASCPGAHLLLGRGSEATCALGEKSILEGKPHVPAAARGTPPLGGGTGPCPGKKPWPSGPQRTPRAGDAQEDGQPRPCTPPDATLPAGQGRTFTTPTAPHSQQEGPPRRRGPPRESSRARAGRDR